MLSCWIITEDGLIGTENQCIGIAEAMGIQPEIKRIGLRQPWKTLSPYLGFESSQSFTGSVLEAPWPDLVIASGRKSIAASRYIKRKSGGKTVTVQIQDPRISAKQFDLVAVPAHDPTRGDNVLVTTATPNKITQDKLDAAKEEFAELFGQRPAPRVAVLIGGNSKAYKMTRVITEKLAAQLKDLSQNGYSLMITASRRTGEENEKILQETLQDTDAYIWDGQNTNPYFGLLGWADYIIVTSDSASMVSEAATTGKPVYMVDLDGGTPRFDRFHEGLIKKGIIRRFTGTLEKYDYEALNDAQRVADAIFAHMKTLKNEV